MFRRRLLRLLQIAMQATFAQHQPWIQLSLLAEEKWGCERVLRR